MITIMCGREQSLDGNSGRQPPPESKMGRGGYGGHYRGPPDKNPAKDALATTTKATRESTPKLSEFEDHPSITLPKFEPPPLSKPLNGGSKKNKNKKTVPHPPPELKREPKDEPGSSNAQEASETSLHTLCSFRDDVLDSSCADKSHGASGPSTTPEDIATATATANSTRSVRESTLAQRK